MRGTKLRSRQIEAWFGVHHAARHRPALPLLPDGQTIRIRDILPRPNQITLLTGPSGSGKSTLLNRCRRSLGRHYIDLDRVALPHRPVIELLAPLALQRSLEVLARLGLAEAHTWLLTPDRLSTGQRWRLRLALAVVRLKSIAGLCLCCDEFASTLDSITAPIVTHSLRRTIDRQLGARAIIATSRDDIADALQPALIVECDFGTVRITKGHI